MKFIIFDAFGTLIEHRGHRINAYDRLTAGDAGQKAERRPFLTRNVGVDVFARELGLEYMLPVIERELAAELAQLAVFEEVPEVLKRLRARQCKIAVCSNLAQPYGEAVHSLVPGLDGYIFSYLVGARKPEPPIYDAACDALGCRPKDALFIGDSKRADFEGPQDYGMQARLIDRKSGQTLLDVLKGVL